jgi:hypothetical protein
MADAGLPFATVEAVARYLRQAGLWPKSGRGGGKAAVHVEAPHFTNLGLGLAAHLPIDAPEVVRPLRALVEQRTTKIESTSGLFGLEEYFREMEVPQLPERAAFTLGEFLDIVISRLAQVPPEVRAKIDASWNAQERTTLIINPDLPGSAYLTRLPKEGGIETTTYSAPSQLGLLVETPQEQMARMLLRPRIDASRQFKLPMAFVFVAADLVADTRTQRGDTLFPSSDAPTANGATEDHDGGSPAEALPETENGADVAPARAASTPSNNGVQPRANGTNSHSAKNRGEGENAQAPSSGAQLDTFRQSSMSRRRRSEGSPHARAIA